jgi:FkbM family methyltransferase
LKQEGKLSIYTVPESCQIPSLPTLYEKYFGIKTHGVFVEVGANDGEMWSNTCGLADIGWKGFYIEPLPDKAKECKIRHANNDVVVSQIAIALEEGQTTLYRSNDEWAAGSTLLSAAEAQVYAGKFDPETYTVNTLRLDTYLKDNNVNPEFDLLSIDTEGTDIAVLQSMDVEYWKPTMIIIETHSSVDKTRIITDILRTLYTRVYEDSVNCIFVLTAVAFTNEIKSIERDVRGVMSVPRLMFSDSVWSMLGVCAGLHVDIDRGGGAYWGQTLNKVMNSASKKCKYILAIDYDSLFDASILIKLYDIMEKRPDIDCIAPLQTMRITEKILCAINESDLEEGMLPPWLLFCDTFEVNAAHFGFTLLRVEALKKVPKPWFVGYPGVDGDWGDDRVDEDCHFWNQWREAGNNIHIANKVVIGHLELMACYPDKSLNKFYVHPSEVFNHGQPAECGPMKITEVIPDGIDD